MDNSVVNLLLLLFFLSIDYSFLLHTYDFQCLKCDNLIDGPGCGEFTREIPVQSCRTFCYFAVLHNRSHSSASVLQRELTSNVLTRAIRDCSPYEDISIEGNLLLQSKLGPLASTAIDIITMKRCNSEQCNNDFYLQADELMFGRGSFAGRQSFPCLFFSLVIIFSYSKSIF